MKAPSLFAVRVTWYGPDDPKAYGHHFYVTCENCGWTWQPRLPVGGAHGPRPNLPLETAMINHRTECESVVRASAT